MDTPINFFPNNTSVLINNELYVLYKLNTDMTFEYYININIYAIYPDELKFPGLFYLLNTNENPRNLKNNSNFFNVKYHNNVISYKQKIINMFSWDYNAFDINDIKVIIGQIHFQSHFSSIVLFFIAIIINIVDIFIKISIKNL